MSSLINYLIKAFKQKEKEGTLPIEAIEGQYYSPETGGDPPTLKIDWEQLEKDMNELEQEFSLKNSA